MLYHKARGYTLAEMLLVTGIVGLLALVALPNFRANDPAKLDVAASETASALRYARGLAISSGQFHGVAFDNSSARLRVYKLNTAVTPPSREYTINHPRDKRVYDITLGAAPNTAGVSLSADFRFGGSATVMTDVSFDKTGGPVLVAASNNIQQLDLGQVRINMPAQGGVSGINRLVILAPRSGKLSVQ